MSDDPRNAPPRIAVVGSLNYDILVSGASVPRMGETSPARSWAPKCGGKGGNQAIEAARHGATVSMIGRVGADQLGDALVANLKAQGVDAGCVLRSADGVSGLTVALFDESGDYRGVFVPGANAALERDSISGAARRAIEGAAVLLLQNETPMEANVAAAEVARAAGCRVIWNAAPVQEVDDRMLTLTDILVVNAIEAEGFGAAPVIDLASAEAAARALAPRAPSVVVTAGEDGLAIAGEGRVATLAAHEIRVASTHGAGDAFCGALAVRLAAGFDLGDAVIYASAAAATLVATHEEDRPHLTVDDTLARVSLSPPLTPA
ncbi:PfkB family carbohydrate kinase [Acuticoccus mangrovi]|uniref:Ribokinase n=1 Tax=Acuticoccus mangrovi TaxID=2796142 RepID=A0A934IRL9_9HYPH|nr:PfkB family carbohydrate kinase [Acuticoccus mangrovi]MBJ3777380.1 bifunctional hydroxymethylpyrimidine kinase/phosphomethylpyrimidine kinase [Acuticoccus mangrovi]